jgi:CheY-like chemotaxis protein
MTSDYADKSVLVLDNSSFMTRLIKNILVSAGFTEANVWTVNDGNQANMMLDLKQFDLITSGIHLKTKSGIKLLQELRQSKNEELRKVPFLLITSERSEYFEKELEGIQINGYLQKPFSRDALTQAVRQALNGGKTQIATTTPVPPPEEITTFPLPQVVQAFSECMVESLGQYMVAATAKPLMTHANFKGEVTAKIDLTDAQNSVKILIAVFFPQPIAENIYAGIFGETDATQVPALVMELANILGGIIKPKITPHSKDIFSMVHAGKPLPEDQEKLVFNLGLPSTDFHTQLSAELQTPNSHKFGLPFELDGGQVALFVQLQTL